MATIPQFLGEELLTILPFLATVTFLHSRLAVSRRAALLWAYLRTKNIRVSAGAHIVTDWSYLAVASLNAMRVAG